MKDPCIFIACPRCGFAFQLPVSEALSSMVDAEIERRLDLERQEIINLTHESATKESDERNV